MSKTTQQTNKKFVHVKSLSALEKLLEESGLKHYTFEQVISKADSEADRENLAKLG